MRTEGEGGAEKVLKEEKIRETGGRRRTLLLPRPLLLLSVLLWRMKTNERRDHGAPTAPLRFISHSAVVSFPIIPSILPPSLCPQQSLSSSVFISPPLPPSVTFHVVTHYSADISPSVPPSLPPFLPYWCWPSPPCLGLDGTEGEKAGEDVPDGRTLNSKSERRDGGMKEETETRRGEDLWVCTKDGKEQTES